ncbi:MAG: GNAT family N-acetyltransferase [Chitinispirillia bacterium]|nr:GNAT family N-acetyltransferase [Chitinispirillia bacterium]MCL2267848.1 GNAT family N-acetyltransferase [Chitinispirillia bacterium]
MADACVTAASRERWLEVAKACPCATYFHTPYWYELIAPGQRHIAVDVTFDDGVSAIIPIAKIKRAWGLLMDHFSSPPGGAYGGWFSASALNAGHIRTLAKILTSHKNLTFRINPFDNSQTSLLTVTMPAPSSSIMLMNDFTHTLDLTKGRAALLQGMARGHRSAAKIAERGGIVIKTAETVDEWEKYYGLYMDSVNRWLAGGPERRPRIIHPPELFRRIRENRTGHEILWLAVKDGEPVSGAVVFYWGRHAVYWHGASAAKYFHLRPNNLLFREIIADAADRGAEIFDFNPSGGYGGVETFKERFGARRVAAPVLLTRTPLRAFVSRIRRCCQAGRQK